MLPVWEGPLARVQSPSSVDTCVQSQKGFELSSKLHWVIMAGKKRPPEEGRGPAAEPNWRGKGLAGLLSLEKVAIKIRAQNRDLGKRI